eukprot:2768313-Prymnesium_polylepis.1
MVPGRSLPHSPPILTLGGARIHPRELCTSCSTVSYILVRSPVQAPQGDDGGAGECRAGEHHGEP